MVLSSKGHLATSGDIFAGHTWKGTDCWHLEAWDETKILKCTGKSPSTNKHLAQNNNSAEVEKPSFTGPGWQVTASSS